MGARDERSVFVGGLSVGVTEGDIFELFAGLGVEVVGVSLPRNRQTGRPRGHAIVTFASADVATEVRARAHGTTMGGQPISVRPYTRKPTPTRGPIVARDVCGVVRRYDLSRGFGFVDGGETTRRRVFVHVSVLELPIDARCLIEGERVRLDVAQTTRGLAAATLRPLDEALDVRRLRLANRRRP